MSSNGRTDSLPPEADRKALASEWSEPEQDRLLDADELAKRWAVDKPHVYRLARENRLPEGAVIKLGKYVRFSLTAIREFESKGGTE
jgi:excisionase family DNA binding protein